MYPPRHLHSLLVAARFLGLAASFSFAHAASASTAIYSQTFDNTLGTNRQFNAAMNPLGWSVYTASTGTKISSETLSADSTIFSSPPSGTNGGIARVYLGTDINLPQASVGEITFDSVRSSANGQVRLLIQIGGDNWYVSTTVFNPVTASSWAAASDSNVTLGLTFSSAAANWSAATLAPDSAMSISGTALTDDLPSGNITGIGWWVTNLHATNGVTVRLDTMQVMAIPEPSSFAALAGAAGLGSAFLRRRRHG